MVSGCAKKISSTVENLNNQKLESGIYYGYIFNNEELLGQKPVDPDLILDDLKKDKIRLTDAWYKGFASACCPPNTNRCTNVIVSPVFLIKVEEEIGIRNFAKVDEPRIGLCAYTITHYKINTYDFYTSLYMKSTRASAVWVILSA